MKKIIYMIVLVMISLNTFAQNMTDTVFSIKEIDVFGAVREKAEISKLNVPLEYLPLSVSSVPSKLLDTRGIINLQDAVKFLPNTRMRTTYGAYQQFEVRGFDHTPIMIDGVRDERTSINNSAPQPDLSTVESVELLKGPASVLYGHSTVGGIINMVRKNPISRKTINALMSYGTWDNKRAMIDFGDKLVGPFNYRAVVNWSDNEGYRDTNDKRFTGYLALGAKLNGGHEIDIRGGFNRDFYGTEIGLPKLMSDVIYNLDGSEYLSKGSMLPGLNKRWRYNNESDFMKNHASNLSVRYSNQISDALKIENRIAYNYDNIDYFSTEALSYLESDKPIYKNYYMKGDTKRYIALDTVQLTYPLRFAYTVHTLNEQLEASGKVTFDNGMKYNYVGGYNFVMFIRDTYRGYNGNNPETGAKYSLSDLIDGPGLYSKVPVYNPHSMGYMDPHLGATTATRNYTHGVYLQNLFEFSEKFKVMVAGRFDHFTFKTATQDLLKTKERERIKNPDFGKTNSTSFTYRVGVVYLPIENMSVYGSFANLYMPYRDIYSPDIVYLDSKGNRFHPKNGEKVFDPETGYQAEIGTRYSHKNILQVTASAFYIRKNNEKKTINSKNYKDPEDNNSMKSVVAQVGSTESKGFELELIFTPTSNAMLSLGYGYTDASIRKFSGGDLVGAGYLDVGIDTQKGMRLAGVPKNTFYAAGNYNINKGLFKGLSFNATLSYTDNVYRDLNKSIIYPSYWMTDLGTSYKLNNGIQLRVNVNNVFDVDYFNQSLGTQVVPCNPRNFLFTVAYSL